MTNPEDNRTATISTSSTTQSTSGGVLSQSLPTSATTIPATSSSVEPETTYIFPDGGTRGTRGANLLEPPRGHGHSRSVSHGGGTTTPKSRPSALKSSIRGGHQRALSQGQITDTVTPPRSGHTRAGSKTDFILPPGHKDSPPRDISSGVSATTAALGHSRQASRSESIYTLRRADLPPWWKRFCRRNKSEEYGFRLVVPNHTVPPKTPKRDHPNGPHCGNKIRTTKYTLLSFIPKNLLEQFHRVANLYFIFIVLLNWFPQINAFGKEIAMIPVLFVLGVTAIKDLFEDRRRRASDKRINNTTCRVYNG
jgi:phospholipid-translocating ATPase